MEDPQTLAQFYQLREELETAVGEIGQLATNNFGKKVLLKKDYVSLLDLMRESVATARVTIGFLRLIFKINRDTMSQDNQPSSEQRSTTDDDGSLSSLGLKVPVVPATNDAAADTVPALENLDNNLDTATSAQQLHQSGADEPAQHANLEEVCYAAAVANYEVSPKNILELASDRGFEDINCEGSLLDPSLIESSLDTTNVSIRRKRKTFLGSSGEDTFDDLNQETLDLIQSGKLDISQICQEKENMSFNDVCRLNVAIFDPVLVDPRLHDWTDWRDVSATSPDFTDLAVPDSSTPSQKSDSEPLLLRCETPDVSPCLAVRTVHIRRSVITPKCKRIDSDLGQSGDNTPPRASATPPPSDQPPLPATPKYNKDTKEIDQKESPKIVVLFDTRLSTGNEAKGGGPDEAGQDEDEACGAEAGKETSSSAAAECEPGNDDESSRPGRIPTDHTSGDDVGKSLVLPPEQTIDAAGQQLLEGIVKIHSEAVVELKTEPADDDNDSQVVPQDSSHKSASLANQLEHTSALPPNREDDGREDGPVLLPELRSCLRLQAPRTDPAICAKSVKLGEVTTYFFARRQGWLGVPKEGGNTLGMEYWHKHMDTCALEEEVEPQGEKEEGEEGEDQQQENPFSPDSFRPRKMARLSPDTVWTSIVKEPGVLKLTRLVEEEREESKTANTSIILNWSTSPHLSPTRPRKGNRTSGRSGLKGSVSSSGLLTSSSTQPTTATRKGECGTRGLESLSSRARKSLLKREGVRDLDPVEAMENKFVRQYRNQCGCSCTSQCLPGLCECVDGGIQCSEERAGFPCACSAADNNCTNPLGTRRFDPTHVKMHFIQTMFEVQGGLDIN